MIILSTILYELILIYSIKKQRHGLAQFHSAWDQLIYTKLHQVLSNPQKCIHGFNAGGGGGLLPYVCILHGYVPRERPPFSALNFCSGALSFSQISPKCVPVIRFITISFFLADFAVSETTIFFKSVPEHHHITFLGGFCRSGDSHFPNAKRSVAPRANSRPEHQRQTRPGNSGE